MRTLTLLLFILAFGLSCFAQSEPKTPTCNASEPEVVAMRKQFLTLDPSTKVKIWREQLTTRLKGGKLNADQRKVVVAALKLFNEELYIQDTNPNFLQSELGQKYLALQKEIRANFSLKEGAEIFERVDPVIFSKYSTAGDITPNMAPTDCNCSTTWTFCSSGTCWQGCAACKTCVEVINCGPFWGFTCDGMCGGPS